MQVQRRPAQRRGCSRTPRAGPGAGWAGLRQARYSLRSARRRLECQTNGEIGERRFRGHRGLRRRMAACADGCERLAGCKSEGPQEQGGNNTPGADSPATDLPQRCRQTNRSAGDSWQSSKRLPAIPEWTTGSAPAWRGGPFRDCWLAPLAPRQYSSRPRPRHLPRDHWPANKRCRGRFAEWTHLVRNRGRTDWWAGHAPGVAGPSRRRQVVSAGSCAPTGRRRDCWHELTADRPRDHCRRTTVRGRFAEWLTSSATAVGTSTGPPAAADGAGDVRRAVPYGTRRDWWARARTPAETNRPRQGEPAMSGTHTRASNMTQPSKGISGFRGSQVHGGYFRAWRSRILPSTSAWSP